MVERQVANHLEGVPFYDPRSDLTGTEISNRFIGNKRSNSDYDFKGASRDGFPKVGPDSLDGVHLMKVLFRFDVVKRKMHIWCYHASS